MLYLNKTSIINRMYAVCLNCYRIRTWKIDWGPEKNVEMCRFRKASNILYCWHSLDVGVVYLPVGVPSRELTWKDRLKLKHYVCISQSSWLVRRLYAFVLIVILSSWWYCQVQTHASAISVRLWGHLTRTLMADDMLLQTPKQQTWRIQDLC
jgi:hypothetical protein